MEKKVIWYPHLPIGRALRGQLALYGLDRFEAPMRHALPARADGVGVLKKRPHMREEPFTVARGGGGAREAARLLGAPALVLRGAFGRGGERMRSAY
jgi:hypothetical protein